MATGMARCEDEVSTMEGETAEVEVDLDRGTIEVVKRYKLWHDFGPVKRFFLCSEPGYVKYIERRGDSFFLVVSDVEKGVSEQQITGGEAGHLVIEAVKHWIPHYEWCE